MISLARLYLKWLWLKKTWRFLWAHKPLCQYFQEDVLQLGVLYLCRSCACTYAGIFVGMGLPLIYRNLVGGDVELILVILSCCTIPLSSPQQYKRLPRPCRDILRFSLGMIICLSFLLLVFYRKFTVALPLVYVAILFARRYYKQRSLRKIEYCQDCVEYSAGVICSGYHLQVECIREYEEQATAILYGVGYTPTIKSRRRKKRE